MRNTFRQELKTSLKEIIISSSLTGLGIFLILLGIIFIVPVGIISIPLGIYITVKGCKKSYHMFVDQHKRHKPMIKIFTEKLFKLPTTRE